MLAGFDVVKSSLMWGLTAVVVTVLFLGVSRPAKAEETEDVGDWSITMWGTRDGLHSNVVRGVVQSPDGHLWLATMGGMARFDGSRFQNYGALDIPGLRGPRFLQANVDLDGDLWTRVGMQSTLRYSNHRWVWAPEVPIWESMTSSRDVGLLFGGSRGVGRWSDGSFELLADIGTRELVVDHQGRVWGGGASGAYRVHEDGVARVEPRFAVGVMVPLPGGEVAVYNEAGEVWSLPRGERLDVQLPRITRVWDGVADAQGNQWLALSSGVYRVSAFEWNSRPLSVSSEHQILPPAWKIRGLTFDEQGRLWLSSEVYGLCLLKRRHAKMLNYTSPASGEDGMLWATTSERGLAKLWNDELIEVLPIEKVANVTHGRSGDVFVTTSSEKREAWRCDNEGCVPLELPVGLRRATSRIFETGAGDLVMKNGQGETFRFRGQRILETTEQLWLGVTSYGDVWFEEGFIIVRSATGTERIPVPDGVRGAQPVGLFEDSMRRVWMSTYGQGLWLLVGGELKRLTTEQGLPSDMVGAILEHEGGLWINSNRGVFTVQIESLLDVVEHPDQLISSRLVTHQEMVSFQPAHHSPDGRMVFSTIAGLSIIDPRDLPPTRPPPPAMITNIRAGTRNLSPPWEIVELTMGQRSFAIDYTAPYLDPLATPWFRYWLEGIDEEWNEVGDLRSARYGPVPVGRYRFVVQARNEHGEWGPRAEVVLEVPARLYESRWLRGTALALFAVLLLCVYVTQRRLIRVKGIALVKETQRRRAEARARRLGQHLVNKEEVVRRHIALELHDDISQRMALLAIELDSGGRSRTELGELARSLCTDVNRLAIDLYPKRLERLGLIDSLRHLVGEVGQRARYLEIVLKLPDDSLNVDKDVALCVYRVTQEALNNMLRHSNARRVWVRLSLSDGDLHLTLADDGDGFDTEQHVDGLGLAGMAERVYSVGGEFTLDSGPGAGTCITVCLPNWRPKDDSDSRISC